METASPRPMTHLDGPVPFVQWSAVIAGAIAASALSVILVAFASGLGLAIASPSPTWRDTSVALALLSGLFLILMALASFGFGGYVAGRMRARWTAGAHTDEVDFRDGMHGVLVWGLAVVATAVLTALTAGAVASRTAPAATSPMTTAGEPLLAYELDRLFRADRRPADAELTLSRAEASRILLRASGREGLTSDDRAYLSRLVASRTGIAQPDAERRVDEGAARAREAVARARRSAVIVAFMTAAALVLGAAAAWFAACLGGRHRDEAAPSLMWRWQQGLGRPTIRPPSA